MKTIRVGLVVMATMALPMSALGEPIVNPTSSPPGGPVLPRPPDVHITSVTYTGGAYVSGTLPTMAIIENRAATPASNIKVTQLRLVNGVQTPLPMIVTIPANGTMKIVFNDPDGLAGGCEDKIYGFTLSGPGWVDTRERKVTVHPTCTFNGSIKNQLWTATDAQAAAKKANHVYIEKIHFPGALTHTSSPLSCNVPIKIEGELENATKVKVSPLVLLLDPTGKTSWGTAGFVQAFPNAPHAFTLTAATMKGYAGSNPIKIQLQPGLDKLTDADVTQGISLDITRTCSIDVKLAP